MRKRRETREESHTDRAPVLEELESRLLLDGDLRGSGALPSFSTLSDSSTVIVDLDRQEDVLPGAAAAVDVAFGEDPPGPEIVVLGNGVPILDGDTTPSTADGTDFGMVLQGDHSINCVFTVRNDGTAYLLLGTVIVPTGFTLAKNLPSSLEPAHRTRSQSGCIPRRRATSRSPTATVTRTRSTSASRERWQLPSCRRSRWL